MLFFFWMGQWWNKRRKWKLLQDKLQWKHSLKKETKLLGAAKAAVGGEAQNNTGLPQVKRKISNKQVTYNLEGLWKEEQTMPKVSGRKEIIKIRKEIK